MSLSQALNQFAQNLGRYPILLIYFWRIFRISILMALSRCITTVANR